MTDLPTSMRPDAETLGAMGAQCIVNALVGATSGYLLASRAGTGAAIGVLIFVCQIAFIGVPVRWALVRRGKRIANQTPTAVCDVCEQTLPHERGCWHLHLCDEHADDTLEFVRACRDETAQERHLH